MSPNDYNFQSTLNSFKAAAKKFRKSQAEIEVLFIHVDVTKNRQLLENIFTFFHIDPSKDVPCNRIARPDEFHSRYVPEKKDFTESGFTDFTRKVLDGKLSKTVRSAPLPADWDKYTLKILVGKNYEDVTRKKGQIVFVMYTVAQDEKCKRVMPVLEEVAIRYIKNKTVTIATMDVSLNDGEVDVLQEVPTFKMFTADNKIFRFNGTRTVEAITKFIDTNGESETDDSWGEEAIFEFQKLPEDAQNPNQIRYEDGEKRESMWSEKEFKNMEEAIKGSQGLEDKIQKDHPNQAVYQLTEEALERVIKEISFLIVCFHAPESRSSADLTKVYVDAATQIHKENKYITFTEIDISKYDIGRKHNVREVPLLRFYKHGRYYDFYGEKSPKHIVTWVHMAMNSPYAPTKMAQYKELKSIGTTVVGCFPDELPKDEFQKFLNTSAFFVSGKNLPLPIFVVVANTGLMQEAGLKRSSVTIFKKFDLEESVEYEGSLTDSEKLLKWCEEQTHPIVFPFGDNEFSYRVSRGDMKYQHILFMDSKAPFFKETYNNFKSAAELFMKTRDDVEVLFVYADTSKKEVEDAYGFFHIHPENDLPCNRITEMDEFHSRFLPSRRDFSKEGFIDFTRDVMNDKIPMTIISDPLPPDWDKYPLKILVGSNYEKVTRMKGLTVFVMYYIPDNENCQRMFPVFDELALRFRNNKTIMIAAMDVSRNDGELDVHFEYPSFKLFSQDNRVKRYKGERSVPAMKAFVDANGAPNYMDFDPSRRGRGGYEYEEQGFGQGEDPYSMNYAKRGQSVEKWREQSKSTIADAVREMEGNKPEGNPNYLTNKGYSDVDDNWNIDSAKFASFGETPSGNSDPPRSPSFDRSRTPEKRDSSYSGRSPSPHERRYHDEH